MNDPEVKKFEKMQADIQDQIQAAPNHRDVAGPVAPGLGRPDPHRVRDPTLQRAVSGRQQPLQRDAQRRKWHPRVSATNAPRRTAAQNLREGFQFYNSGTQAVISGPYPLKYVASITPGTVRKVWAMRTFNGLKQMAAVPPSYYTISTEAIGQGMTATFITLNEPLSTIAMVDNQKTQIWENAFGKYLPSHIVNQIDWEDELYVSFTSDVGPNAVDIMEWIITNFSQQLVRLHLVQRREDQGRSPSR